MRNILLGGLSMLALGLASVQADAGVAYNTTLASPGAYWGSGNSPDNFVTDTESYGTGQSVEIGLGTITRYVGPVIPDAGTSTYRVPTGDTAVAGESGANWGFPFSVNLDAASAAGSAVLGDIVTSMSITDVLHGTTVTFDPLAILPDNAEYGPAGTSHDCSKLPSGICGPSQLGFQNSESLSFTSGSPSGFDPSYNANDNDTYLITLSATCVAGVAACPAGQLGSVSETIIQGTGAVPEPGTLALLGVGCLGLLRARRRRAR